VTCSHRPVAGPTSAIVHNKETAHRAVATGVASAATVLFKVLYRFPGEADFRTATTPPTSHFANSPLYFVTFCTHERQRFLANDEVHTAFIVFAKRAEETFSVAVGRHVIMPDHVHLFVRGDYNFRLGRWIGALKQPLAKGAALSRAKGQIWEEGFFDHVLHQ